MKIRLLQTACLTSILIAFVLYSNGKGVETPQEVKIIFLHHSTGSIIFKGNEKEATGTPVSIPNWFLAYNNQHGTFYSIIEKGFPKSHPYGWRNYPFDYYNIWVKHGGDKPFMEEPTLEMLTKKYDVIIFKHCFPVSQINEDIDTPDIDSPRKTLSNYKLQYNALKQKMAQFPDTKFIVWTGAAMIEHGTTEEKGRRAREFFNWMKNEWDSLNDNIYIWDFFELETEGGLFLKAEYAASPKDSHPNIKFAVSVLPLFGNRIVDVIENNGTQTTLTGKIK